jgi:serine/threonine-protein kinase
MATPDSLVGKQLDQFRLEKFIAKGAMGMVFKAFDTVLARTVALKLISTEMTDGACDVEMFSREEARKRLIQEAKAAGRLSHPNIVTIHCYGEAEGLQYICMEYVDGKTLNQVLRERKVLTEEEAMPILAQVLSALEAAGRENIIHRDIKPANIMLMADNRVKVMDFGIAKLPSLHMTVTGMILGTPYYMSPEQISGRKVDVRSDLFSVGAVLYELLTGERPFVGENTAVLTYKIMQTDPIPPNEVNRRISQPMADLVLRALAKNPADRYQSPAEMLAAFKKLREDRVAVGTVAAATILAVREQGSEGKVEAGGPSPPYGPEGLERPSHPEGPGGAATSGPVREEERADEGAPPASFESAGVKGQGDVEPEAAAREKVGAALGKTGKKLLGAGLLLVLVVVGTWGLFHFLRGPSRGLRSVPPQPSGAAVEGVAPRISPAPPVTEAVKPSPDRSAVERDAIQKKLESLLLEAGKNFVTNPVAARNLLKEALALDPNRFETLMMLARLSSFQKDYAGAVKQYGDALRVNSQAGEAYFEMGSLQLAQGDCEGAIRSLEACLALMPGNRDDVLTNLGFCYWKTNRPQQARLRYQAALEYNPNNDRARALLAGLPQESTHQVAPTPVQPELPDIEGKYTVTGVNPNGSQYRGTATIMRSGDTVVMSWIIAKKAHTGTGSISGRTLTINWKGSSGGGGTATYTVEPDGVLKGVWAKGKGTETLTPAK